MVRALDRRDDLGVGVAVARQQPRALELQRQRRQGVREHVVHVAREPAALGQRRPTRPARRATRSSSTSASASSRRWWTWRSSRMTKNHGVTENRRPMMLPAASSRQSAKETSTPARLSPLRIAAGRSSSRAADDDHDEVDPGEAAAVGLERGEHAAGGADQRQAEDPRRGRGCRPTAPRSPGRRRTPRSASVTASPSPERPGGVSSEAMTVTMIATIASTPKICIGWGRPGAIHATTVGPAAAGASPRGWIRLHPRVEAQVRPPRR